MLNLSPAQYYTMDAPGQPVQNLFGVYTSYGHAQPDETRKAPRWQAALAAWLILKSFRK